MAVDMTCHGSTSLISSSPMNIIHTCTVGSSHRRLGFAGDIYVTLCVPFYFTAWQSK
jgi:hypothetical protein